MSDSGHRQTDVCLFVCLSGTAERSSNQTARQSPVDARNKSSDNLQSCLNCGTKAPGSEQTSRIALGVQYDYDYDDYDDYYARIRKEQRHVR